MLQAMHASNARKQCRYERTDGLTESLTSSQGHLTFRNARAHIPDSSQPRRSSDTSRRAAIARARAERRAS